MGGLSHLFDFHQDSMAKKVLTQRKHVGGLEAPRNSLELPVETSQSYSGAGDYLPYSYEVWRERSENITFPTEASMKTLINDEITRGPNTRRSTPSVVARLMGMDMLPLDTDPLAKQAEKKDKKSVNSFPKKERNRKGPDRHVNCNPIPSMQIDFGSLYHHKNRDPDLFHSDMKSKKPRPREHPQEAELQKFKKEFEAWQAARFKEFSEVVEFGRIPEQWIAQENLNREKIALYSGPRRSTASEKPIELQDHRVKSRSPEGCGLQNRGFRKDPFTAEDKESYSSRSRTLSCESSDFEQLHFASSDHRLGKASCPTRIVILRPGPDRIGDNEESWVSSAGTSEERGSIEDFLEEVKERLKCELQGKSHKRGTMIRGGGIETLNSEKPPDAKQIAQHIAKQVRESITGDMGMNLLRSDSTRSYRSEIQFHGPGSPEFINRDSRRFLAERLRNVLKEQAHPNIHTASSCGSRSSMSDNERGRLEQPDDSMNAGSKVNCGDIVEDEPEIQIRSFRCAPDDDVMHSKELSPRNLIRSLSAPVSGTSFGKLLLEDRHILTGAHIRRKHEAIENVTLDAKKGKKEKFNFKEKVTSFKYSFTLRGKLFRRKFQSAEDVYKYEHSSMKDIMSGPTVMMNYGNIQENSTEVPPSPASVCSSSPEEWWRAADHLSPTSASELSPLEETSLPQVFREISCNLNELRRQLNALETNGPKETVLEEQPSEVETMELEDPAEAYIRDLLIASGLYESSFDKVLSRWDPFAKPINNHVFEEVEELYRKTSKHAEGSCEEQGDSRVDHKLLLDLSNEALSAILGPPVTVSMFKKKVLGPVVLPPQGSRLLDCLWEIIRAHIFPPTDKYCSIDSMVGRDLRATPWSVLLNDEIDALGKGIESQITAHLIEEVVRDVHSCR